MINPLLLPLKQKLIISGVVVAMAAGGVTAALNQPAKTGADTSPIVQQVNHNTDELANHEGRITNTENDVKDLQNKTGTPPSTTRVVVQDVTTPAASAPVADPAPSSPAPVPAPVTVARSTYSFDLMGNTKCNLIYTDGSTKQVDATVTQNGNSAQDNCQSFVGQPK